MDRLIKRAGGISLTTQGIAALAGAGLNDNSIT